jgi:hypothetical protein
MEAAATATLIRARCPELSARDLATIESALNGQVLPLDALELILALVERLEQRIDDIETRTPHRLM